MKPKHENTYECEYETINLKNSLQEDSPFSIRYKKGAEHDFKIFLNGEDVTDFYFENNLVLHMLYTIINLKESQ